MNLSKKSSIYLVKLFLAICVVFTYSVGLYAKETSSKSKSSGRNIPILNDEESTSSQNIINNNISIFSLLVGNNPKQVKELLSYNPQFANDQNLLGETPIMYAFKNNLKKEIIVELLKYSNLFVISNDNKTALMYAIQYKADNSIIKSIIRSEIDINAKDIEGNNALLYSAMYNPNPIIMHQLYQAGISMNHKNNHGDNALILAAKFTDNTESISFLLNHGLDLFSRNLIGQNSLMLSTLNPNLKIMRFLLNQKVKIKNNSKTTYIDFDINERSSTGYNALMYAISNSNFTAVKFLLDKKINLNAKDIQGKNAFLLAVQLNSNIDILEYLVKKGINIHEADDEGKNAIMYAAEYNSNPEILHYLISLGVNPRLKDNNGLNSFDYAKKNPHIKNTKMYWEIHDLVSEEEYQGTALPNNPYSKQKYKKK